MWKRKHISKAEREKLKKEKEARKEEKKQKAYENFARTLQTTTKQLVWWFAIHGTIWIYLSYILAFMNRTSIAETLSSTVCQVIIGSMIGYIVSKTVENVFKFNNVGGKSNAEALRREGIDLDGDGIPDDVSPEAVGASEGGINDGNSDIPDVPEPTYNRDFEPVTIVSSGTDTSSDSDNGGVDASALD